MVWLRVSQAVRAAALAATAMLVAGSASATSPRTSDAPGAEVRAIDVVDGPQGVSVSVITTGGARLQSFVLATPDRLVIDAPGARMARAAVLTDRSALVSGIRHGALPQGGVRLVLDLVRPARAAAAPAAETAARGEQRHLIRLTALSGGPASRAAAKANAPARIAPPLAPQPAVAAPRQRPQTRIAPPRKTAVRDTRPVIVIDAGHGGRDPGAIGRATGLREKDVTLRTARMLRDQLRATGRYELVMTRDGDRFLELEERVTLARARDADLFISLHADSNPNPQASGASVYTLSERGVDRARALANRHNWVIEAVEQESRPPLVEAILMDLAQRETTNRSAEFAGHLIPRLGQQTSLLRNTHRNAGFFVLLAPDVPAVLIELGFLTNRRDEGRLGDPARLRAMAGAIAKAVDAYFQARSRAP